MAGTINWRERIRAAGVHFILTAMVGALAAALVFLIWFPGSLAEMAGGRRLLFLLIGIDLVLGPLVSLIIYNSAKSRGKLIFDYCVVGALQIAALLYGVTVISQSRPLYIVFAVDRLEVVASLELDDKDLAKATDKQFSVRPLFGPRLAAVELPTDAAQNNALLFSAVSGKDVQMFPQYYRPYASARSQILDRSFTLQSLQEKKPKAFARLSQEIAAAQLAANSVRILPVHSRFGFWTALIDAQTGEPRRYLRFDIDTP